MLVFQLRTMRDRSLCGSYAFPCVGLQEKARSRHQKSTGLDSEVAGGLSCLVITNGKDQGLVLLRLCIGRIFKGITLSPVTARSFFFCVTHRLRKHSWACFVFLLLYNQVRLNILIIFVRQICTIHF